ncbi:hypothetical protein KY327_01900 [Candidatus Woesearchaeota archaeon]|nr:hypothetical protein [Candidatus Woesearchaeota archaeon]
MALLAELLGALAGDGFIGNYGSRKQQFMVQLTGHRAYDKDYFKYLKQSSLAMSLEILFIIK